MSCKESGRQLTSHLKTNQTHVDIVLASPTTPSLDVLEPVLLIVMDFVEGGTLTDFVEAQNPTEPPALPSMMKILVGSARGLLYLHSQEPTPMLHRDIKSENILLTDLLEPRIADLGEARAMARDQAMTIVSHPPLRFMNPLDKFIDEVAAPPPPHSPSPPSPPHPLPPLPPRTLKQVGTNGYTAPEVLRGEHYGTPADIFSFAIVMCELLT